MAFLMVLLPFRAALLRSVRTSPLLSVVSPLSVVLSENTSGTREGDRIELDETAGDSAAGQGVSAAGGGGERGAGIVEGAGNLHCTPGCQRDAAEVRRGKGRACEYNGAVGVHDEIAGVGESIEEQ